MSHFGTFFGPVRDIVVVSCSQSTFSQETEHPPRPTMLCQAGLEEESQDTVCEVVKFISETNLCEVHPRDVFTIYRRILMWRGRDFKPIYLKLDVPM